MLSEDVREWDGSVLGPGPFVILMDEPGSPETDRPLLVAGPADGAVVTFPATRLAAFVGAQRGAVFLSGDEGPLRAVLVTVDGSVEADAAGVWEALGESRWADLGLLDQFLRGAGRGCV